MSTTKQPETTPLVGFTDRAIEQVRGIFAGDESKKGLGIRLGVIGGGCSGFSYRFDFSESAEGDHVLDMGPFEVYIDLKSAIYLKGVTVDYEGGLTGKGFIFQNPNASNTCGCGESFGV